MNYFKALTISLLAGLLARVAIIANASFWLDQSIYNNIEKFISSFMVFSDNLNGVKDYTIEFIDAVIIAPVTEGLALLIIFFLVEKTKLHYVVSVIIIIPISYFSHESGLRGYNATIAFVFFSSVYAYTREKLNCSLTLAYLTSTLSHVVYNFLGLYIKLGDFM